MFDRYWDQFKYFVYLLGWTYIVLHLTWMNYQITQYLLQVNLTHAVVTILLTTALYPIYIIGVLGIIREWRSTDDKSKEDLVPSSGD